MKLAVVPKYWCGEPEANCDICSKSIGTRFIDGRTRMGSWANMCGRCHTDYGVGLGTGKGQRYDRQTDGRWLKTA